MKATITATLNNRGGMEGIAAKTTDGTIYIDLNETYPDCSDIYDYDMLEAHLADLKVFAKDLAGTYPWDDEEFKVEFGAIKSEDDEEIVWDATITKL
jgi:hypothetical protein|nr:MAG TPA: hypothetical protein [Caudoviricetes sp.]